jgi:hypothetical protein
MKDDKIAATLFETTCIGFFGGFVGGVLLYFVITLKAIEEARQMDASGSASHLCAAGTAATALAILSLPAGALFGLCLGGFFLWRKSVARRRPLP